jgi:hypothetical protein
MGGRRSVKELASRCSSRYGIAQNDASTDSALRHPARASVLLIFLCKSGDFRSYYGGSVQGRAVVNRR